MNRPRPRRNGRLLSPTGRDALLALLIIALALVFAAAAINPAAAPDAPSAPTLPDIQP